MVDTITGYVQAIEYDSLGRAWKTGTSLGMGGIDGTYYQRATFDQYGRAYQTFDASGTDNGTQNVYDNTTGYLKQIIDATGGQELYAVIAMNARGQVTQERSGGTSAVITTRTYDDAMARLKGIGSTFNGNAVQTLSYNYDDVGNLTWRNDQSGGKNVQEVLTYDVLNRLSTTTTSGAGLTSSSSSVYYDGYGNIKNKGGVAYAYGGNGGPHAAATVGSTTYVYDANGNNISSSDGRTITYSTFDKPLTMTTGGYSGLFAYDPSRNLYKRLDTSSGQTTQLITIGGVEFVTKPNGSVDVRRYLPGGIQRTTTYTDGAPGATTQRYLLKDHLGSIDVILASNGSVEQAMSFDAWGLRRTTTVGTNLWSPLNVASLNTFDHSKTTKGYTGHEMVDEVGIIHMGGRIYDPRIARFLQADPTLQAPTFTQNYNRYSYVVNNPLTLTDPTGYKYTWLDDGGGVGQIVTAVISVYACSGNPYCVAGATTVTAKLQGASWNDAFRAGAIAGVSAWAFGEFGVRGDAAWGLEGIAINGTIGGITSMLGGGNFGNGFLAAGLGMAAGAKVGAVAGKYMDPYFANVLASAVVGGTASALTGGKFSNGAMTAAFAAAVSEASRDQVSARKNEQSGSGPVRSNDEVAAKAQEIANQLDLSLPDYSVAQQKSVMGGAAYGTVQKVDGSWEVVVEARMSDDRLGITLAEELIHLHQKTNSSYYGGQISSGAMNNPKLLRAWIETEATSGAMSWALQYGGMTTNSAAFSTVKGNFDYWRGQLNRAQEGIPMWTQVTP